MPSTLGIVLEYCPHSNETGESVTEYLFEIFSIMHTEIQSKKLDNSKGACIVKLRTIEAGIGSCGIKKVIRTIAEGYTRCKSLDSRNFILV